MWKIIDTYIFKKFLSAFFFVVGILISVVCIIHYTDRSEKFIENQITFVETLNYYLDYAPYIANQITPLTIFIAAVFVTSQLATHTEIIAMLSSGISFRRIMVPYMAGAILIGLLSFYISGWVIPNSNKDRIAFEMKYFEKSYYYAERDIHIKIGPQSYLYLGSYNNNNETGYKLTLETIKGTKLKQKLTARRMEWQEEEKKWKLKNWSLHEFDSIQENYTYGSEMDTTLMIHPKDFSSDYMLFEALTMEELYNKIGDLRSRGADDVVMYEIESYVRFASPFAVIILTFIALIVSARKTRGGQGFQIALGFLIAFIFIIFFIFSRSLAESGAVNPAVAVWIPNIIFGSLGLLLYRTVPR
jgi:lipopolysaccharide export system permease protein